MLTLEKPIGSGHKTPAFKVLIIPTATRGKSRAKSFTVRGVKTSVAASVELQKLIREKEAERHAKKILAGKSP